MGRVALFTELIAQPLCAVTAGAQYNYFFKEKRPNNSLEKKEREFWSLVFYILEPVNLLYYNQHPSQMVLLQRLTLF